LTSLYRLSDQLLFPFRYGFTNPSPISLLSVLIKNKSVPFIFWYDVTGIVCFNPRSSVFSFTVTDKGMRFDEVEKGNNMYVKKTKAVAISVRKHRALPCFLSVNGG